MDEKLKELVTERGLFRTTADLLAQVYTRIKEDKNPIVNLTGKELQAWYEITDLCEAITTIDVETDYNPNLILIPVGKDEQEEDVPELK